MSRPVVTVLMSVYNGQVYLGLAIDSILAQTYSNFELLIIDDGSTDNSLSIIKGYAKKDKRIQFISQKNQGLEASLNLGLKRATSKYIARHDADDLSSPDRLQKQIDFLEAHPKAVLVGSSINVMNADGKVLHKHALLLGDAELRQELLIRSPFAHGSVMFRRQPAIDAGSYKNWPAEDYDLWLRLSNFGELANLDEYLYMYREHNEGISGKNKRLQEDKVKDIQAEAWKQRDRLIPNNRINLDAYKNLDMGQLRIKRIIENSVFILRQARRTNQRLLALKITAGLAGNKYSYRKLAGMARRRGR